MQGQSLHVGNDANGAAVNQATVACEGVKWPNDTVWLIDRLLLAQIK